MADHPTETPRAPNERFGWTPGVRMIDPTAAKVDTRLPHACKRLNALPATLGTPFSGGGTPPRPGRRRGRGGERRSSHGGGASSGTEGRRPGQRGRDRRNARRTRRRAQGGGRDSVEVVRRHLSAARHSCRRAGRSAGELDFPGARRWSILPSPDGRARSARSRRRAAAGGHCRCGSVKRSARTWRRR